MPLKAPTTSAVRERGGDADLDAVAGMHDDGQHHAAQAQHRSDRQVDAAGDDHQRHAERDDGDEGEVAGDVVEVLRRREGIGREATGRCRRAMTATNTQNVWLREHRRAASCAASARSSGQE